MKNKRPFLDILGISSASLCMVHCLIFPLLTFIPFGLRHDSVIDLGFALVSLWAVIQIIRNANLLVIVIILNSITLILFSIFIEIYLDLHTNFIYLGGFGMIIGHFLNYKSHSKNNQEEKP
ncbi:MerC domain-containing protein [Flavobacterium marginilacus]|uniref:MerC domain-containing protein n=1 Tax=Flavobacterium marginilacus TaxID=3003256 RepID=UPI00248DE8A9|nr:MerC domain-containing protein [Flavobacterium marginilacus]